MSTQTERIKRHREDIPKLYLQLYDRVMSGTKANRTDAIKLQCLECWAFAIKEAQTCDNYACPLYPVRAYRKSSSVDVL